MNNTVRSLTLSATFCLSALKGAFAASYDREDRATPPMQEQAVAAIGQQTLPEFPLLDPSMRCVNLTIGAYNTAGAQGDEAMRDIAKNSIISMLTTLARRGGIFYDEQGGGRILKKQAITAAQALGAQDLAGELDADRFACLPDEIVVLILKQVGCDAYDSCLRLVCKRFCAISDAAVSTFDAGRIVFAGEKQIEAMSAMYTDPSNIALPPLVRILCARLKCFSDLQKLILPLPDTKEESLKAIYNACSQSLTELKLARGHLEKEDDSLPLDQASIRPHQDGIKALSALASATCLENLKILDTYDFKYYPDTEEELKLLLNSPVFKKLERVDFSRTDYSGEILGLLSQGEELPNLKSLTMKDTLVKPADIAKLAKSGKVPNLECLNLAVHFFDREAQSLDALASFEKLITLDLSRTRLPDEIILRILSDDALPSLRILHLDDNDFQRNSLLSIVSWAEKRGLECLTISSNEQNSRYLEPFVRSMSSLSDLQKTQEFFLEKRYNYTIAFSRA